MKKLIIFLILPLLLMSCNRSKDEIKMIEVGLAKPLTTQFNPLKKENVVASVTGKLLPSGEITDLEGNKITFNVSGYFHFYIILNEGGIASRDIYKITPNEPLHFSFEDNLLLNEQDSVIFPGEACKIIDWALLALTDSNLVNSNIITSQNVLILNSGILINPEGTAIYFSKNGRYFISLITKSYTITTTEKVPLTKDYILNTFFSAINLKQIH